MAARCQVGGGRVVDPIPGVHRPMPQADRQVRLPDPGRADEEHVARLLHEAQRGQLLDQLAVERGLRGEVEVVQPPRRRERGEAQPAGMPPCFGRCHFDRQQPLQEGGVVELLLLGPFELGRQDLADGRKPQVGQVAAQPLVGAHLAHRAPSASSA